MANAVFYSLSTMCQYLTMYCLYFCSLCPLLHSTVCPLSVSTSHCNVCWYCVNMSTAVFYSLSNVNVSHSNISTFCVTISTAPLYQLSVSTSHYTFCCFRGTISTSVFYSLYTLCQYLTLQFLSPDGWSACCINLLNCFTLTALRNWTLTYAIFRATKLVLLSQIHQLLVKNM
jgi:hypothetical protein